MDYNKKLLISFLLPNAGVGGGVRAIVEFGNQLLNRGHQVRIFYRTDNFSLRQIMQTAYLKFRYGNHDWLAGFQGESQPYDTLKVLDFSQDEIILSMCARTTLDAHELPEEHGIKVLHCHGAELENWEQMSQAWKLPKYILVVSSHLIDMFKEVAGKDVLGIVPDGVDMDQYYPAFNETERRGVGAALRWRPSKAPEMTISVINELKARIPQVSIYSYGSGRRPDAYGVDTYLRLPSVTKAREIYSKSIIWLLTSKNEGFGMPVLEAMACGCIVISTKCGGPEDVIQDGVNGFIVPVDDVDAMVLSVMCLLKDTELRKKMQIAAYDTARNYTWHKAALQLEEFLFEIYESHDESISLNKVNNHD